MSILRTAACLLLLSLTIPSCKKFLDEKPDRSLVIPNTPEDLLALLDNSFTMNSGGPTKAEAAADNYFLTPELLAGMVRENINAYLWDTAADFRPAVDWQGCYQPIYSANVALAALPGMERTTVNANIWDNVKGTALFHRSRSFLSALWIWSKAYDRSSASTDLGIPLRMTDDYSEKSVRVSVEEGYAQVLNDLKEAAPLLPNLPVHPMRPSKTAAYTLLARTYLSMREYDSCLAYSQLALQLKNDLLDFNTVNLSANYPIPRFNPEVVFHVTALNTQHNSLGRIDTVLYQSYHENDIRKSCFFRLQADGYHTFRGSYNQSILPFTGATTTELYLMRAEMLARKNRVQEAMEDINTLLSHRFVTGTFEPLTADGQDEALTIVLAERRKELLWRQLRWIDIKRLNKDGANISLTRSYQGRTRTLEPNAPGFALPLPEDVIALSGMPQN